MFTLQSISEAHSKVNSGADFPKYIQELITLGVTHYETFVDDGHTKFYGIDNYEITSSPKHTSLIINEISNELQFKSQLKAHQQGQTSFTTFCQDCAQTGVFKWVVSMNTMTCTYYNKAQKELLMEFIPKP